jgi:non-heme chloroperoxidase
MRAARERVSLSLVSLLAISLSLTPAVAVAQQKVADMTQEGQSAETRKRYYSTVEGAMGVPLLVMETGIRAGPTILFIHGMSQSHLAFEPQFQSALAEKYRLVALDLRGHGGSAKPWKKEDYAGSEIWAKDVAAVIEALRLDDVTISAWSFGTFIAAAYVRHFGTDKLHAVNLSGGLGGLAPFVPEKSKNADIIAEGSRQRASLNLRENIAGYEAMPNSLTAGTMEPEARATAFHSGLMNPSYVRRAMTDLPLANADVVAALKVPVLISAGSEDVSAPDDVATKLAGSLADGRLSLYAGVGHFPSEEATERFNRELADLVERNRK